MAEETAAAMPAKRVTLFITVFACTLATAFYTVFALGVIYHPGPANPAVAAPVESAVTDARRVRRREAAAMWAGDPKKEMQKKKKVMQKKKMQAVRKKLVESAMKSGIQQKSEAAAVPPHPSHTSRR